MKSINTNDLIQLQQKSVCLYSMDEVNKALDKMAKEMTEKLAAENPIFLCVMKGALVVVGHLLTRLNFPLELDYIHVTRYRGSTRGGDLHWLVEPREDLKNRTVVIIDDIMDGGLTLASIIDYCNQVKAKKVYSAVMVNKKREREPGVHFEPDFVGVTTGNQFLYGFGLDYEEYLRNAPGIYAVNE